MTAWGKGTGAHSDKNVDNCIHSLNHMNNHQNESWNVYVSQLQLGLVTFFNDIFSPMKDFTQSYTNRQIDR